MAKKFKTADAQPLPIERYIKLMTEKELPEKVIVRWFQCVQRHAPSGVLKTITIVDNRRRPRVVSMVHRVDGMHNYLIPLTRDLIEPEVARVVKEFAAIEPKLDFDVETNSIVLTGENCGGIKLDDAKHAALCATLAKQSHETWMRERSDAGWRFGTKYDAEAKTHPLLRPWTDLPDRYRQPDLDWPNKLVQLLNDQGYAVVPKDELERLLATLHGVV